MSIELQFKKLNGKIVSPVRKITKVYPLDSPALAMVFRANPGDSHEARMAVLELLKGYGATVSFVVTGDIAENDKEFVKAALAAGCELVNGGNSGRPYSAKKLKAPSGVLQLNGYESVLADVSLLHNTIDTCFDYVMKAGMPPYGVESIEPAINIYDLYDTLNYQYIAGSDLVEKGQEGKLSEALKNGGLNGHVAVLDICEVSALKVQIDALADASYGVCTVSELLSVSPFSDIGPKDPTFEPAKRLLDAGYPIAMRNNCVMPHPYEIVGDTLTTLANKGIREGKIAVIRDHKTMMGKYTVYNPYCAVMHWTKGMGNRYKFDFPLTSGIFRRIMSDAGYPVDIGKYRVQYRRSETIRILADILCATAEQDPYGVFDEHLTPLQQELRNEIGEEEFNKIKEEIDARHAAEAEAEKNGEGDGKTEGGAGKKEGGAGKNDAKQEPEEEKGTILDRYEKKHPRAGRRNETEIIDQFGNTVSRYSDDIGPEEEEAPETNKDQIVL